MIRIKIETDRALVTTPTLRVLSRRYELYLWWAGRPRMYAGRRPA